jgi:uncharacterized protein
MRGLLGSVLSPHTGLCSNTAGMSWSGFRPSDDATKYGYNIPGNMYAVAALERAIQLNVDVWQDADFGRAASRLASTIRCENTFGRCNRTWLFERAAAIGKV